MELEVSPSPDNSPEYQEDLLARLAAAEAEARVYRHAFENARQELQSFAYTVSHDLRAPLRAIEGFSKILVEDYGSEISADAKVYLQHLVHNAQQLSSQIDDLLKFYRLGKNSPQKLPVDAGQVLRELLEEQTREEQARISLSSTPPEVVLADPTLLRDAFGHLLANALKFSRPNPAPQIEIGSRREKGCVTFYFKDNGVGFEMAYIGKLFQVFQKLHSPAEFPGNGIGLAMVRRIAEAHGGRVWAEAEPDKGATFYLSLPIPPESAPR